jgi:hypothetical protein
MQREGLFKVPKRSGSSIVERTRGKNPEAIGVSDIGISRRRSHEKKSPNSQNPESIVTVHRRTRGERSRFRGNPQNEISSIWLLRDTKGKSRDS